MPGLWFINAPLDISPITVTLLWHKRTDRDAGQRWLRQQIQQATQKSILALPTLAPQTDCDRHGVGRWHASAFPCLPMG